MDYDTKCDAREPLEPQYQRTTSSWKTGFWKRFPRTEMLALLSALIASAFMIHIVALSDGQPITHWKYQPTVYLSVNYMIANLALQYALTRAITTAWWLKAIKGDTTVRELHDTWALGSGLINIMSSPRSFNVVALAGLAVTMVPMNGPLLQRASAVVEHTYNASKTLEIPCAHEFSHGFTGDISGRFSTYDPNTISDSFSAILKQYNNRQTINITGTWCEGTCTGKILGAGYNMKCQNESMPYPKWANRTREDAGYGFIMQPFDSNVT